MRTTKKSFLSLCMAAVMTLLIPSIDVYAADTYTVTYRPGNVGYFATEANAEGDKQAMAAAVAAQEYSGYSYEVTKNGAIKVEVSAGAAAPNAPTYIQAENGYFVKSASSWGPAGEVVDKNTDYVVDYGKLVDGVEYTVKYVDSVSGESIAPVYIAQANIGENRSVTAPAQIVISGATVYNLVSQDTLEFVLDADSSKNVFTFSYKMAPSGTSVEEVVIGADGQIITTTEYVTTTVDGGRAGGAVAVTAGAAGDADGDDVGDVDGGQEADVVEIGDGVTPLAGADEEENADMVNIADGEVPLAQGEAFANMAMIGATVFTVAAVLLAIMWLFMKKKKAAVEASEEE